MMEKEQYYDQNYYRSHCGVEYARGNGWEEVFGNYADRIVKEIQPQKSLDVGCAVGFFVESLRDRGVEAYGIDVSEYAIASVREDIKPYCKVKSALLPIEEKYDLITCIEVLEHLNLLDIPTAIQRMCEATDDIIFSSTPFDYAEESHVSVRPVEFWVEQFAYNGFYHDVNYDCSYISIQAMRFRRTEKSKIELMRDYERKIFSTHQENVAVRNQLKTSMENVEIYRDAYQKHVDMINQELNPKINELNGRLLTIEEETARRMQEIINEKQHEIETLKIACCDEIEALKLTHSKEIEEINKNQRDELEAIKQEWNMAYSSKLAEEIKKRKHLEEKKYYYEDLSGELSCTKIELEQLKMTNDIMQKEMNCLYENQRALGLMESIKQWYVNKRKNKELIAKGLEFWKPVFDPRFYAEHNKDVYDVYGTNEKALLKHFVCVGMYEGRRASKEFDVQVYMRSNPDVVAKWRLDKRAYYMHYVVDGKREGRRGI